MDDKIREVCEELRVFLQNDGGDMEIVEIEGNIVRVRLQGACGSCPHSTVTLKNGVEAALRDRIDPTIVVERVM